VTAAVNGHPAEHPEPLLLVRLDHDGTAEVAGCVTCANPEMVETVLRKLADTVRAHPGGYDGPEADA
jgi:hypothetical protein